mgnify:CR=1 FL=1
MKRRAVNAMPAFYLKKNVPAKESLTKKPMTKMFET